MKGLSDKACKVDRTPFVRDSLVLSHVFREAAHVALTCNYENFDQMRVSNRANGLDARMTFGP